jgi:hypothetical protein
MKPLQTLDHVILWFARIFSFLFFAVTFYSLILTFEARGIFGGGDRLGDSLFLGISAISAVATWRLSNLHLRIILGLVGASFCALIAFNFLTMLAGLPSDPTPHRLEVLHKAICFLGILLLGFATFIWTSLRCQNSVSFV